MLCFMILRVLPLLVDTRELFGVVDVSVFGGE